VTANGEKTTLADRIVVGYFGDRGSLASAVRASAARGIGVVAVAFDLGGKTPLSALRDDALSLGALRCHALDVREDFARDVIVPALAADAAQLQERLAALALRFVRRSLESIAKLEAATALETVGLDLPWRTAVNRPAAHWPATITLRFAHHTPVELNGITMTPAEILESLETIAGQPALDVLHAAFHEASYYADGIVELRVADGRVDVVSRLVAS
jgi:argininosuccinate synthase